MARAVYSHQARHLPDEATRRSRPRLRPPGRPHQEAATTPGSPCTPSAGCDAITARSRGYQPAPSHGRPRVGRTPTRGALVRPRCAAARSVPFAPKNSVKHGRSLQRGVSPVLLHVPGAALTGCVPGAARRSRSGITRTRLRLKMNEGLSVRQPLGVCGVVRPQGRPHRPVPTSQLNSVLAQARTQKTVQRQQTLSHRRVISKTRRQCRTR
jgi:hypothetical protein